MAGFNRTHVAVLVGVAVVGAMGALPGCDWLSGSDNVERTSPYINNLAITRPNGTKVVNTLCGKDYPFMVSFDYSDLQGDISEAKLLLRHTVSGVTLPEESYFWPENVSRSTGRLTLPTPGDEALFFPCPSGTDNTPRGEWQVEVTAVDDLAHESNILKDKKITLL